MNREPDEDGIKEIQKEKKRLKEEKEKMTLLY